MKILILEEIHDKALQNFDVEEYEITRSIHDLDIAEVICCRSKTIINKDLLDKAPKLLAIGCFCNGINNVDLNETAKRNIKVFNSPNGSSRSVAELVIGQIFALSRQLGDFNNEMHYEYWNKHGLHCHEIRNKTLGIIGYGPIGSQVGILAEAIGMNVLSYDIRDYIPIGNVSQINTLEQLLQLSDFITIHVPLLPSTKNLISFENIKFLKKGCYLINNSRGGIINHNALIWSIENKKINGVALDVYPDEPKINQTDFNNKLINYKNVFLTPHIGGSTEEAQYIIGNEVSKKIIKYIDIL